jgi:hypothetical protein
MLKKSFKNSIIICSIMLIIVITYCFVQNNWIEVEDIKVNRISAFTLTVKQTSPGANEDDASDDGGIQQ